MTTRIGNTVVICAEPDKRCQLCGEITETRPAGPNGEQVCHLCALKDPAAMKRYFERLFQGGLTQ
jgi:formylmethanofuran dehydrogenase subunit E